MKATAAGEVLSLSTAPRPIKVRNLRSAKRLLSRLITQLQAGQITGQDAKDLTYLLSVFVMLVRDHELEERIESVEAALKGRT